VASDVDPIAYGKRRLQLDRCDRQVAEVVRDPPNCIGGIVTLGHRSPPLG
jgi:hypothetical protein